MELVSKLYPSQEQGLPTLYVEKVKQHLQLRGMRASFQSLADSGIEQHNYRIIPNTPDIIELLAKLPKHSRLLIFTPDGMGETITRGGTLQRVTHNIYKNELSGFESIVPAVTLRPQVLNPFKTVTAEIGANAFILVADAEQTTWENAMMQKVGNILSKVQGFLSK